MEITKTSSALIGLRDSSEIGEARRAAQRLAARLNFSETDIGKIGIIVTEAATNVIKHGRGGNIILSPIAQGGGLEVLAVDKGPGMGDVSQCLADGYSTQGTPGTGLGAMRRMSNEFEIYSRIGQGTVLLSRVYRHGRNDDESQLITGGVSVPYPGETVCGDGWSVQTHRAGSCIIMADGLGHGPIAAEASQGAIAVFERRLPGSPAAVLELCHLALKKTRGAAVVMADISLAEQVVRYAGVGNLAASILAGGKSRSLVSLNGIVGHQWPKVQEYSYPWSPTSTLVISSDGLGTQWDAMKYPGLLAQHPSIIASVLHRDFTRGTDDVSVVVVKHRAPK